MPESPDDICGVRFERGEPVHFARAGGLALRPGDEVIVTELANERLGRIVIAPGQLLGLPQGALVGAVVVRQATSEDGQGRPERDRRLMSLIPGGSTDWLVAPGSSPRVEDDREADRFAGDYIGERIEAPSAGDGAERTDR